MYVQREYTSSLSVFLSLYHFVSIFLSFLFLISDKIQVEVEFFAQCRGHTEAPCASMRSMRSMRWGLFSVIGGPCRSACCVLRTVTASLCILSQLVSEALCEHFKSLHGGFFSCNVSAQ